MANYATNLFYARTENEKDLKTIEKFLSENFCECYLDTEADYIDGEFSSKWCFPETEMHELVSLLEGKEDVYIRVLTHELCNEYVSFRVFEQGEWEIRC